MSGNVNVVIGDRLVVIDMVGRFVPIPENTDPELLAVVWNGASANGLQVFRSYTMSFDDPAIIEPWIQLWEEHPVEVTPEQPSKPNQLLLPLENGDDQPQSVL